ncbi:MAG TPA: glycosyltransferase family 1 protein, partial [Pirellulales bacterium]|nr:glycosyltransferase family 1 protein [Pirellulales bacterium]
DEIDAVISFEPFDDIWNEPIHRCRTRLISWFHDAIPKRINEGHYWNPDRFDRAVTNACYRAHRIVCVSRSAEQDLLTFFAAAKGKTQVIHLGHDKERFARGAACDRATAQAVLASHGISSMVPYLFFLGAVEPRKNMVNVLRACQVIRRRHPRLDFQLVLAGDVSGQSAILRLIERTRQWLPVHALRYTTDAESAILAGRARALLNPSLWEGFGIPILEGMTAGAVVVASELSSMPEVCAGHAILCDPYDINDMAEKFLRVLTMNARERQERATIAREYSSQFTWPRTAAALWAVIEEELAVQVADDDRAETIDFEHERACA